MRRRIRLTGRRQLSRSSVAVKTMNVGGRKLVTFAIADAKQFQRFPADSRISLRLVENKVVELVEFGTVGGVKNVAELKGQSFAAPSCQLLVASSVKERFGLLLGSTDTWTLHSEEEQSDKSRKGILLFQPAAIQPRTWKLEIREDDYPVVYIDERIPDPRGWARNDPSFLACALPSVVQQVFGDILDHPAPADIEWMVDWLAWADMLMPGRKSPTPNSSDADRNGWLDDLVDSFCQRHHLADRLFEKLKADSQKAEGGAK